MGQSVKRMSKCQKDVMAKSQTAGLGRMFTKKTITKLWDPHIMTSILMAHMKIIKIAQKDILWIF